MAALARTATTEEQVPDRRRITEHDADFRRLHAHVERTLWAGIRAYVQALRETPPRNHDRAASAFITHQTKALQLGYLAGHWEGERDYWHAMSARHSPQAHTALSQAHGVEPNVQRMRRTLMFYGAASIAKMAREGQDAWRADERTRHLAESFRLDAPANAAMAAWLHGLTARVALSADVVWTGMQDGYLAAGTVDPANPYAYVWWDPEPGARHCFPAGTGISTPSGVRPIEAICVGDMVTTLSGPRQVTRLYRSIHRGELTRVQAGDREVRCTPNHPFLTQRGWVEAGALRDGDQVVLAQDCGDLLACHIRLPDANEGTTVYNLEVEEVHHYIANGFVVHNCGDCPDLAAASPYTAPGSGGGNELPQTPGDGGTACGGACKCTLRYGSSQASGAASDYMPEIAKSWHADNAAMPAPPSSATPPTGMGLPAAATTKLPPPEPWRSIADRIMHPPTSDNSTSVEVEAESSLTKGDQGGDVWRSIADALMPGTPMSAEQAQQRIPAAPADGQLTEGQKAALDLYRKAALAWDAIRGTLPTLDLFTTEAQWQNYDFSHLTPEQIRAYAQYVAAVHTWVTSTPGDT